MNFNSFPRALLGPQTTNERRDAEQRRDRIEESNALIRSSKKKKKKADRTVLGVNTCVLLRPGNNTHAH